MRTPRIYHPGGLQPGTKVTLDETAARHVTRVLRLQPGAPVILFNGEGGEYHGVIAAMGKRATEVEVKEFVRRDVESALKVILAPCLARGDRMDYLIQKAVELGVSEITPLTSERCEVRLNDARRHSRLRHWQGICVNACEQSGRNLLPQINHIQALPEWLDQFSNNAAGWLRLVLDGDAENSLSQTPAPRHGVVLLTGPEGGLTKTELATAQTRGFQNVHLGPRTLRAETAPVAALSAVQTLWGDF